MNNLLFFFLNRNKGTLLKWLLENGMQKEILNERCQPNGNSRIVDTAYLSTNIKNIMANLAKQRIASIETNDDVVDAEFVNLQSKLSTQSDMESPWARHWLRELNIPFRYHRKFWEYAFVLQVLYDHGMFGKRGLGLACGSEIIPSYLISQKCRIVAGDKPFCSGDASQEGWASSSEYTESKESLFYEEIVDRSIFDDNFTLKYIDMNALPEDIHGQFDFCWSICAFEHLGSIHNGLNFLKNSLNILRSGGISVHTTEFNLFSNSKTIDNWGAVLFTKEHFCKLSKDIAALGGEVYPFDFSFGNGIFDQYIDMPPFVNQSVFGINTNLPPIDFCPHIKLLIDGFPATCAGIIIKKH